MTRAPLLRARRLVHALAAAATGCSRPSAARGGRRRPPAPPSRSRRRLPDQRRPTLRGVRWRGYRLEGLLPNSRMVQGVFDDLNSDTRARWAYPDTNAWDRIATPASSWRRRQWRRHGLLAITLNLRAAVPEGYSGTALAQLSVRRRRIAAARPTARAALILNEADRLGMAVILGLFYFGQDERLRDEAAVTRAVDEAVAWVHAMGYRNVLVEINNECDIRYDHGILQPDRVHELIVRAKRGPRQAEGGSWSAPATAAASLPGSAVLAVSDFVLLHGNGVTKPDRIAAMVRQTRQLPRLHAQAHRLQRGRSLRLRRTVEQFLWRPRAARVVGLLRLSQEGARARTGATRASR